MTIDQIATKFEVTKATAYGLVRFLQSKGLAEATGTHKVEGAKGKGSKLYALKADAAAQLGTLFGKLPTLGN